MLSLAKPAKRYGHVDDPPLDYGGGISNLHDTNLLRVFPLPTTYPRNHSG